jgi:hypothetical protein
MKLKLLPSETFTIHTQDSIEIVRQKLMMQLLGYSPRKRAQDLAVFRGQVTGSGFKVSLADGYYVYLHTPTIIGKFDYVDNETLIHIKIRPTFFMYSVYLIYVSSVPIALLNIINPTSTKSQFLSICIALVFSLFLLIFLITFQRNSNIYKTRLAQVILD